jgi:phenylalanyl-tRNA synthetase alpha chain
MENRTEYSNIGPSIEAKIGRNLHNKKNHPIEIIKRKIYEYFNELDGYDFAKFDDLPPYVNVSDNFDKLLIPKDHPARSRSDTYYINKDTVLRTQTSAHQNELLAQGHQNFLVTGDVYRKDEIDKSHYPVFHQMEGTRWS